MHRQFYYLLINQAREHVTLHVLPVRGVLSGGRGRVTGALYGRVTNNEPPLQTRNSYIGYHYYHWQFYNAT